MIDFGILTLGHLVGDYIFQNDWMANNKTSRHWPCVVHCLLYTAAIALVTWVAGEPWGIWPLLAVFALHYPVDRWRLARWWMVNVSRQRGFAEHMGRGR